MANQNARQDDNQFYALIGHSGTAGTAETRRIIVNDDGSLASGIKAYNGTNWQAVKQDPTTRAFAIIDYPHYETHNNSHYFIENYSTLGSGAAANFCVQTPNTAKWAHMYFSIQTTGQASYTIYEGADWAADGTAVNSYNSNRNATATSSLTISVNNTIGTAGTIISDQKWGLVDTPSKAYGGERNRENELILKQNTKYVFKLASYSANNIVSYQASWYEHTNATP